MSPRMVLVVDDSKLMHKMYGLMLRQYALLFALDGRQALEILEAHPEVDLILLDVNMPVMNGLEVLAEMRQRDLFGGRSVIIISTEGREEDTARGLEAGAAAYLKKPFHSEELMHAISQLPAP